MALLLMSAATWPERGGWAGKGRDDVTLRHSVAFPPGRPLPCLHLLSVTLVPALTVAGAWREFLVGRRTLKIKVGIYKPSRSGQ